jgi:activating signal cointegrator 1
MKTLCLIQPWASLFVAGQKRIETRSWAYRGDLPLVLAVHASKKWTAALAKLCLEEPFRSPLAPFGVPSCRPGWDAWPSEEVPLQRAGFRLPFGAIIGLVRLVACVNTVALTSDAFYEQPVSGRELAFGDYTPGRYGWVCDRFHALPEPIPAKGALGLWDWSAPAELQAVADGWLGELLGPTGGR